MCGIAGILQFTGELSSSEIKAMTDVLIHRGPDGEGQWCNENKQIGLGHRRLSIIDLTLNAAQPMHWIDRYTIVFNGEIYNYLELKQALQKEGFAFKSNSDTEVILALFSKYSYDCLKYLDGMFAFAIWDENKSELFCARDRLGEKPFYYSLDEHSFNFASEMKALFSKGIKKDINRKKVFEYLYFSITENPYDREETFYNTVKQLAPATYLTINRNKEITKVKYWGINTETTFFGTEKQAEDTFKNLFINSIKVKLRSDVTVGSSLSGGLDSSSIVCIINKLLNTDQEQHVFSARFPGYIKDEGIFIDEVIKSCKHGKIIKHEVFPDENSMLGLLEKIMYYQEEPFGSASIAAQFEVMRCASKNGVKVLLDGQGADELLAGYTPFYNTFLRQQLKTNLFKYLKSKSSINAISGFNINLINVEGLLNTFMYKGLKRVGNIRRKYVPYNSNFFLNIHPTLANQYRDTLNPFYAPPNLKEHLKFILLNGSLSELLKYADRNSMANSVEIRLPFLDPKLIEFVFSLPPQYLINNGWSKHILRKSMEGILPEKIQWRRDKIGYEPPQAKWMENSILKEKMLNAQEILIKEEVLIKKKHSTNWHHLMLGMLYEN